MAHLDFIDHIRLSRSTWYAMHASLAASAIQYALLQRDNERAFPVSRDEVLLKIEATHNLLDDLQEALEHDELDTVVNVRNEIMQSIDQRERERRQ